MSPSSWFYFTVPLTQTQTHKPEWLEPLMHKPIRHTESESLLPSSLQQDYRSLKMYFYKAQSGIVLHTV